MKKLLLSIAALTAFSFANAETVTLDVNDATDLEGPDVPEVLGDKSSVGRHIQPLESLSLDSYNFAFSQGTNKNNAPAYYWSLSTSTDQTQTIRVYNGNTMTIAAPAGVNITKIEFKGANGASGKAPTVSTGTATAPSGAAITWAGSANSITFTMTNNFRIRTMAITTGEGGDTPVDPDPVDPAAPVTSLDEAFASIPANWSNVKVSGSKEWYTTSFNGVTYAAMTGYKGEGAPYDAWLISPAVDMSKVADKKLTFKTQVNGYNSTSTSIRVCVLTSADPATATVTELPATFAEAPASGYSSWVESGEIDLSAYTGTIYIGFQYTATDDTTATWCVTDVKLNAGSAPVIPDPDKLTFVKTTTLVSGKYVMTASDKLCTAISSTATYGRLSLADVTIANNEVESVPANVIEITVADGKCTLKDAEGRYLAMDDPSQNHFTSFQLYTELNEGCYWTWEFVDGAVKFTNALSTECFVCQSYGASGTLYTNVAPAKAPADYVLPVLYAEKQSGISSIVTDENAPVEFFNLQGVRVDNPAGGLYIRRQGSKVEKVVVK